MLYVLCQYNHAVPFAKAHLEAASLHSTVVLDCSEHMKEEEGTGIMHSIDWIVHLSVLGQYKIYSHLLHKEKFKKFYIYITHHLK